MRERTPEEQRELTAERHELLGHVEHWLDGPMLVLGLLWLGIVGYQLVRGPRHGLVLIGTVIWALFLLDFLLRLVIAPDKLDFLKHNWLIAVSLLFPALRIGGAVRILGLFAVGGWQFTLVRVVAAVNRGLEALRRGFGRKGVGYVIGATLLVTFAGAAAMYAFEYGHLGFRSYGDSLWYTAMLLTTIGSQYWPTTAAGRVLSALLAAWGLGVLGFLTGALASFFVGKDAENPQSDVASQATLDRIHAELVALRSELARGRGEVNGGERAAD